MNDRRMSQELDNHITGHYGEDQFKSFRREKKSKKNLRDQAIQEIQMLYPPDSDFPETAQIGQQLLEQAKCDCTSWKNEPDAVIFRLRDLCIQRENKR